MKKTDKKQPRRNRTIRTKNPCYFTQTGTEPDYKEVLTLKRFTSDRGKIIPSKYSGVSAKNQRKLARELKKARFMALIPYTDQHAL